MGTRTHGNPKAHRRSFGRWTRTGLAVQVGLVALLAAAATLLVVDGAEWRPLRFRIDVTQTARNTLDPATEAILAGLEADVDERGPLEIDVFFDPQPAPFTAVVNQVHERLSHFLLLVDGASDAVRVKHWSLTDVTEARARQAELGYEEGGLHVAVTRGARTTILGMFEQISQVDWGIPEEARFRPATLLAFTAEDALLRAIAEVSESPRVVFTAGHREPGLPDTGRSGLSSLKERLERDGFEVGEWDSRGDGPIPDDTDVLAVIAPRSPLGEKTLGHIVQWVERGGRLVFLLSSPYSSEADTVYELARRFGMDPRPGLVCLPVMNTAGQLVEGHPACGDILVGRQSMSKEHPVTRPISRKDLRLRFLHSRSFQRGEARPDGTLLDILSSGEGSWLDLPDPAGFGNWSLDQPAERVGRYLLAMVAEFPGAGAVDGDARKARVLGVACDEAFSNGMAEYNGDFALNGFNWLAEREERTRVAPRDPRLSLIDVRGEKLQRFRQLGWWGLSGLCVLAGVVTAWRRRS